MAVIRNRVKELRMVRAGDLFANPRNWREHPKGQQDALMGVLREIGYADALIARELPDGTLELVDGHLRAETTPDVEVPVLIVDLSQDEANALLTVLDPLASMAETNRESLESLLREIQPADAAMVVLLSEIASQQGIDLAPSSLPDSAPSAMADPRYSVLVSCEDETQQVELLQELSERGLSCRAIMF